MLYPTVDPATFQAVIAIDETENKRTEVDLTIRALPGGIALTYNGHHIYNRPYKNAEWTKQTMLIDVRPESIAAHRLEVLALSEVLNLLTCRWEGVGAHHA